MDSYSSENVEKLMSWSLEADINIGFDKARDLITYMEYILDRNQFINLTAITKEEDFIVKHLIDSMIISNLEEFVDAKTVIDIGTGAGFPGIPLAVLADDKNFLLVDSLLKRVRVVNEGIDILGLNNISAIHARGENLPKISPFINGADLVIARAVASMSRLVKYTLPNVKRGGFLVALKGPGIDDELEESKNIIKDFGAKIVRVQDLSFDNLRHNAVICQKVR